MSGGIIISQITAKGNMILSSLYNRFSGCAFIQKTIFQLMVACLIMTSILECDSIHNGPRINVILKYIT